MKLNFKLWIWLIFILYSGVGFAGIRVRPMEMDFLPGAPPRLDFRVTNTGERIDYVEVIPYLIENPGTKQKKETAIPNPKELGLLISPQKMAIAPKQTRFVRVVLTKPPGDVDRIYKLSVTPAVPRLLGSGGKGDRNIALKIVVGYGALVTVRPKRMQPNIVLTRRGKEVTAVNKGNTNVVLTYGKQCEAKDKCKDVPKKLSRRLYAGNTWKFTLPEARPVEFIGRYAKDAIRVRSN